MLKSFRRVRTDREDVKQLQDAVASSFQQVLQTEILDGVLIEDLSLLTGAVQTVEHRLGRPLRGWFLVRQNAQSAVWDSQSTNPIPGKTLLLNVSANVTVSLWVF